MNNSGPIEAYKAWVRAHPNVIQYMDWLLYLGVWSPGRLGGSETSYEIYHSVVGLLSVWHQHILKEGSLQVNNSKLQFWLDALEQFETLVEIRAMHLDSLGKMSRYGPLTVVEAIKALLKMGMWCQYSGHLFLRNAAPSDLQHWEAEQGLTDVLSAFSRLRRRYVGAVPTSSQDPSISPSDEAWLGGPPDLGAPLESTQPGRPGTTLGAGGAAHAGTAKASRGKHASLGAPPPSVAPRPIGPPPGGAGGRTTATATSCSSYEEEEEEEPAEQHQGANLVWLAELLHIWRPVVYVSMLKRHGRFSWQPWMMSLAVDLASIYFQQRGKMHMRCAAPARYIRPSSSLLSLALMRSLSSQSWSDGEEREMQERQRQLLLYLLRSPALDWIIRSPMTAVRARCTGVPLAGRLIDYLVGCVDTFTEYYTYTAGSA